MSELLTLIDVPFWEIVVKSTLVIALAAVACLLLGRQSAAIRHRVWVLGLVASLGVPIASGLLPQFAIPVLPGSLNTSEVVTAQDSIPCASVPSAESSRLGVAGGLTADGTPLAGSNAKRATSISADTAQAAQSNELKSTPATGLSIEQACVLGWLLGSVILSALFVVSLVRQSIWLRRLPRIGDNGLLNSVVAAGRAIGIRRPIVALESDEVNVPAVAGVLNPRLVLPSNWRTWSQVQRHCILLHELAHVRRGDVVAHLLGRVTLLVYWFNPLVWNAVKQLRAERELASDDCVLLAGQPASDYAEQLLYTMRCSRPVRIAAGVAMAHSARLDQRVLAILDPKRRRSPVSTRFAVLLPWVVAVVGGVLGGITLTNRVVANLPEESKTATPAASDGQMWKEYSTIEYNGTLPVSVAFSADGKTLLTGDTAGEVMALIFHDHEPQWRWKSKAEGSHAAVAYSADRKHVYVTTENGIRILDDERGEDQGRIEAKGSNPTAIGVFPDKSIGEDVMRSQIVFGTPRGYFIKTWAEGKLPDSIGTIETSTLPKDVKPKDEAAVPLAVDPQGLSAIMTGPIDATGKAGGQKGKNVLWAYVCGNYDAGSPGNRVMPGHEATVVSAAWAKNGRTAMTGDAAGRVIVWDAETMKESRRLELGGRVGALTISDDGSRAAAYVLGKQGEVYVWECANPVDGKKLVHTELGDFGGPQAFASLSFSPDGRQLAGCAIDKQKLSGTDKPSGKVHVWELSAEPKGQRSPKQAYIKQLPKGSSPDFVVLNNDSILAPAVEQGAIDLRDVTDGGIQTRFVMGKFAIGKIRLSTDRKWLAMEHHPPKGDGDAVTGNAEFEVGVYEPPVLQKFAIPSCTQLLDVASGGMVVAVVRNKQIELWDIATKKKLKEAPFEHSGIGAARFSPDGRLLVIADGNAVVLWRWEEDSHERIEVGRRVESLEFSPDGKYLAESSAGPYIFIRNVATRNLVQNLAYTAEGPIGVSQTVYTQGGRVFVTIGGPPKNKSKPRHIDFWDTVDGTQFQQLPIPAGIPRNIGVSPNGLYLLAIVDDNDGPKLIAWRLDGEDRVKDDSPARPATERKGDELGKKSRRAEER